MPPNTVEEQLVKYLTDAHSIEEQALVQMKAAPRLAGDPAIAEIFTQHLEETRGHEQRVSTALAAHSAKPARIKDVAGIVTGAGFGLFAATQPDTPVKLLAHAFSYEHMEAAAYDLLGLVAREAGDGDTAEAAAEIAAQERAMGQRVAAHFDTAAALAVKDLSGERAKAKIHAYLADVHAVEQQSLLLLGRAPKLVNTPELEAAYAAHRLETEGHSSLLEEHLRDRGESPSRLKDAALSIGALNWSLFFTAQPDTPAKLAAFSYAVEHLEIGAYELLARAARLVGDDATAQLAERILADELGAAARIAALFGEALNVTLQERNLKR